MTSDARIYMNEKIIERVYQDVVNHPEVEIGGRWIGHVYQAGEQPSESGVKVDDKGVVRSSKTNRPLVSTLTHTTKQVAEHFLKWRDSLKKTMLGHNGGPNIDD